MKLQYWLLGGRRKIGRALKACPKRHCKHQTPNETKQKEADLPVGRGQMGSFERVALEYAGFFEIKNCGKFKYEKDDKYKKCGYKPTKEQKEKVFEYT